MINPCILEDGRPAILPPAFYADRWLKAFVASTILLAGGHHMSSSPFKYTWRSPASHHTRNDELGSHFPTDVSNTPTVTHGKSGETMSSITFSGRY